MVYCNSLVVIFHNELLLGNVRRYRIDDHNVPSLEQMFELTDDVREWLGGNRNRDRVVALHCKGGKGRTGTMICAILIDMGLFQVDTTLHRVN